MLAAAFFLCRATAPPACKTSIPAQPTPSAGPENRPEYKE